MKKEKNRFGLIKGFGKRIFLLSLVYLVLIISIWTTLAQFFEEGLGFNWIFWVIMGTSLVLWIAFVIYVELAQLKRYGHD